MIFCDTISNEGKAPLFINIEWVPRARLFFLPWLRSGNYARGGKSLPLAIQLLIYTLYDGTAPSDEEGE